MQFTMINIGNTAVDVTLRTLGHLPKTAVLLTMLLESQLCHRQSNLRGTQFDGWSKPRRNLCGRHVLRLRLGARVHEVGHDEFGGRIGSHEIPVVLVELADVTVLKPVALAATYEGESLGIHPLVGNMCSPWIVDAHDVKRQPSAVARLVGEEGEVVAGGSERGHTWHEHRVVAVGRSLVHLRQCGERLQLVDLLGSHGVNLLEGDDDVLREHQPVVLGELEGVALGGEELSEVWRKNIEHKRGLVCALAADEGEDAVVDRIVVHHRRHHGKKPAAGVAVKLLVGDVGTVHQREELPDVVGSAVPCRQTLNPRLEGVVGLDEVGPEDIKQRLKVGIDSRQLHLSPERLDETIIHGVK